LVLERFILDLKEQVIGAEPTYLIFSGDHVKAGSEQSHYLSFHQKFDGALTSAGLNPDKRIVVPGNHDVSQSALKPLMVIQKGTLSEIHEEQQFNDGFAEFSEHIFKPKFVNYIEFERRFAKHYCCADSLGGRGWTLETGIGVYCLNTAVCSFAGLRDSAGNKITDRGRLLVDTRHLHSWLNEDRSDQRILVMHHPVDWLAPWAKREIEKIISSSFRCVFSGHIHEAIPEFHSRGTLGTIFFSAPPLFTKKDGRLGYSIATLDSASKQTEVLYREWSPSTSKFVSGSTFSGTDDGRIKFSILVSGEEIRMDRPLPSSSDTLALIKREFDESLIFYSSKKSVWIDRDFSNRAEIGSHKAPELVFSQADLITKLSSCVIRAPRQFGLTCLGKKLVIDHYQKNTEGRILVSIDASTMPHVRQELSGALDVRCKQLKVSSGNIEGFVIDNWESTKRGRKLISGLQALHPKATLLVLQGIDDCTQIAESFGDVEADPTATFERTYLLSLDRKRIRELVSSYLDGDSHLDDDLVFRRVITDIDSLNIHRTPINCLLLLKLAEQAFNENPVNRTEVIGRVLSLLFFQFNKIPTYASRPDLKDCEYALGYLSEWLIKERKQSFTKSQFYEKVQEYCKKQLLQLDVDVLFAFLVSENLFVKKGDIFEFRFVYWLHYFAAHRMHHDLAFAGYILSGKRYSAFPEILEFYAGIDRRRTDAITVLTNDLRLMTQEFTKRTGIPQDFNPYKGAVWSPDVAALEALRKEVEEGVSVSAIPVSVKDAIADANYNSAKPYNQELARFMDESTLHQMVSAMRGAARVLRNSDHVDPSAKAELLNEVIGCWTRVAQILVALSPILSEQKSVKFEGMNWILDEGFDKYPTAEKRWQAIMTHITTNVVKWYQEDLFSNKLGPLFANHIAKNPRTLSELLLIMTMVIQRPHGWEAEVEKIIMREAKDSFYLNRVFSELRSEYKYGIIDERSRQKLRRLAATAIAKHQTGQGRPDMKLIERAAQQIRDGKQASENKYF